MGIHLLAVSLVIDLANFRWQAIEENTGEVLREDIAIGGSRRCPEPENHHSCRTPVGEHRVLRKYGYLSRSGRFPMDCKNRSVCGARMYWFVEFHRAGIGIHGSELAQLQGRRHVSHGCVRTTKEGAKWLNEHLTIGAKVIVKWY